MQAFLTLAERQFIIRSELDGLRAQRDLRIPGLPDNYTLHHRDNICECCHCRVLVCSDKRPTGEENIPLRGQMDCFVCVAAGQKLKAAGIVGDTFPLHNQEKLKHLSESWYSGNQLTQPLGWYIYTYPWL